jgi:1-deoxy-D-xylulose-5-phosphate synthase
LLDEVAAKFTKVITIENGVITGGLGTAVMEYFVTKNYRNTAVVRIGLPDEFVTHGSIKDLNRLCGLDVEGIKERIEEEI